MQIKFDMDFRFQKHLFGGLLAERDPRAPFADLHCPGLGGELDRNPADVKIRIGIADRAEHPSPVGVRAKHRRFQQVGTDHRFRDLFGGLLVGRAQYCALEQFGCAFAIRGNQFCKLAADHGQRLHKFEVPGVLALDPVVSRQAVRHD